MAYIKYLLEQIFKLSFTLTNSYVQFIRVAYLKGKNGTCDHLLPTRPFISRSRGGIKLKFISNIWVSYPWSIEKNQGSESTQLKAAYERLSIVLIYFVWNLRRNQNFEGASRGPTFMRKNKQKIIRDIFVPLFEAYWM